MTKSKLSTIEQLLESDDNINDNTDSSTITSDHKHIGSIKDGKYEGITTIETDDYILKGLFIGDKLKEGIKCDKNTGKKTYYSQEYTLFQEEKYTICFFNTEDQIGVIITNNELAYFKYQNKDILLSHNNRTGKFTITDEYEFKYKFRFGVYYQLNNTFAKRYNISNKPFRYISLGCVNLRYIIPNDYEYNV